MPKTYTVKEVADILGYSTNSIYTFLKEKRIKGVRVGKGRFRIPEEELSRILHLSKHPVQTTGPATPIATQQVQSPVVSGHETSSTAANFIPRLILKRTQKMFAMPNIFDWFIGLGAVVTGMGLALFNQSATINAGLLAPYFNTAKVILVAAGVGIIMCNLFEHLHAWRRIFYVLLTVVACVSAWALFRIQDFDGAIIYAAMALVIAVNMVIDLDGIASLLCYLTFILVSVVVLLLLGKDVAHVLAFSAIFSLPSHVVAALLAVIAGTNLIICWIGYRRHTLLFWIGAWITAGFLFATAVWYGNMVYWSRSMLFIVLGFFSILTAVATG